MISDRRRREKSRDLEPAVAVRRAHHRDLDVLIAQSGDAPCPVSVDRGSPFELSRFLTPSPVADHRNAPVNALGYLRIMFAVDDIDDTLARLRPHGAELVGELVQYEDQYRLCYIRGPEGILIGLAEQIG